MSHRVEYTLHAQGELEEIHAWIHERSPQAAQAWVKDLMRTVSTLADDPTRQALAPESVHFQKAIRRVLFRKRRSQYRIYYTAEVDRVVILSVRSSLRKPLEPGDLPELG